MSRDDQKLLRGGTREIACDRARGRHESSWARPRAAQGQVVRVFGDFRSGHEAFGGTGKPKHFRDEGAKLLSPSRPSGQIPRSSAFPLASLVIRPGQPGHRYCLTGSLKRLLPPPPLHAFVPPALTRSNNPQLTDVRQWLREGGKRGEADRFQVSDPSIRTVLLGRTSSPPDGMGTQSPVRVMFSISFITSRSSLSIKQGRTRRVHRRGSPSRYISSFKSIHRDDEAWIRV